ncbi:MAG: F0F1 ATP synthase subunit gamma [Planctomycetaceae bacterium]|nr:F0F1 ATP synthase subunit gamma [Planctomycetaceae bacterium]
MAGTRQILQRRKAADSIRRITRTMEMVSTAKYKTYHHRRDIAAEYENALSQIGYLMVTSQEPIDHPLLKQNKSNRSSVLAVGSTRGLCGSYNSHISHLIDVHIKNAAQFNRELDIYATESRLLSTIAYKGITPQKVYPNIDKCLEGVGIDEITDHCIDRYMAGEIDNFDIAYMQYFSASSQSVQTMTILPLTELIDSLTTRSTAIWPYDISFEEFYLSPKAFEVIKGLARIIVRASIEFCFMDAALSEHLARMVAMRSATDNAETMIKKLTNEYNTARQSKITGDLLDIVGGTGALT